MFVLYLGYMQQFAQKNQNNRTKDIHEGLSGVG